VYAEQLRPKQLIAEQGGSDKLPFSVGDYIMTKGGVAVLIGHITHDLRAATIGCFTSGRTSYGEHWNFSSNAYARHLTVAEIVAIKLKGEM
jgi:hypothetical protein